MRVGLAFLVIAYCLSQFFRAYLAVLAPLLREELGLSTSDLSFASGIWFISFAVMQLPVGWALDTWGPRRTVSILFSFGAVGGVVVMAMAQGPVGIALGMALIGIGCAPVLMASYYIFARVFSAAVFGTLAGVTVGVSSFGNLLSAAPLAATIEAFGWRETLWATSAFTALIAIGIVLCVRNPQKPAGEAKGSFAELLRIRALWPILAGMFICYAPVAGIRGLWISPYIDDRFGASLDQIGVATLVMGLSMVLGNFLYGPIDRIFGSLKWPILIGNAAVALMCLALFLAPPGQITATIVIFAVIGVCGASYPAVMSHGRAFLPPHLTGRGVTLLNMFGMGGAGVMQFASGPAHARFAQLVGTEDAYGLLFAAIAAAILLGLIAYSAAQDGPRYREG
ncbi:MFS transporter [Gymnodinialimonas sp. 2305UL16-5]|uniref:MFS transporter n=1 Tax=Gymnodinialimonas mytili TaxID=3126503 RepID=UPI0030AE806A